MRLRNDWTMDSHFRVLDKTDTTRWTISRTHGRHGPAPLTCYRFIYQAPTNSTKFIVFITFRPTLRAKNCHHTFLLSVSSHLSRYLQNKEHETYRHKCFEEPYQDTKPYGKFLWPAGAAILFRHSILRRTSCPLHIFHSLTHNLSGFIFPLCSHDFQLFLKQKTRKLFDIHFPD